jgi:hypothetical protein
LIAFPTDVVAVITAATAAETISACASISAAIAVATVLVVAAASTVYEIVVTTPVELTMSNV